MPPNSAATPRQESLRSARASRLIAEIRQPASTKNVRLDLSRHACAGSDYCAVITLRLTKRNRANGDGPLVDVTDLLNTHVANIKI
jgi:hypothetical protein